MNLIAFLWSPLLSLFFFFFLFFFFPSSPLGVVRQRYDNYAGMMFVVAGTGIAELNGPSS